MKTLRATGSMNLAARREWLRRRKGSVLVPILIVVTAMGMVTMILSDSSRSVARRIAKKADEERLEAAADAAADLAVHEIWKGFVKDNGGKPGPLSSAQAFLSTKGVPKLTSAQVGGNVDPKQMQSVGKFDGNKLPWNDMLSTTPLAKNGAGKPLVGGARLHDLKIVREDFGSSIALRVRAKTAFGESAGDRESREIERLYVMAGEEFKGFGYALLANNVNCIMCHTEVDSTDRYYNSDSSKYGTFERARVGTLQSLKIRSTTADSRVAGTIYTRGPFMDKNGSLITNYAATTLKSVQLESDGRIKENGSGAMTTANLALTTGTPLPKAGNLYTNYPVNPVDSTDGILPEAFPPVIPDENGNRIVDASEYDAVAATATGSVSGGTKTLVNIGSTLSGSGLPMTNSQSSLSGSVDSHVVLQGTSGNPLVLNGRVAVKGDVILQGVVRGTGEIIAGGNIYVVGSVRYADGTNAQGKRTFGVASDGTQNRLTIAAGGNILVGDFLSQSNPASPLVTGKSTGGFNFTITEMALFNQMEWSKAKPQLSGYGGTAVDNPLYDPSYKPRYYSVFPGDPVAVFAGGGTYFNPATKTWMGKEEATAWTSPGLSVYAQNNAAVAGASFLSLMPATGWVTANQLKNMWTATASAQGGGPLQIDGLLYTNNATYLVARAGGSYGGQVIMNGGLIGADMGILVPGNGGVGLQLNYDTRQNGVLKIKDTGKVALSRGFRLK